MKKYLFFIFAVLLSCDSQAQATDQPKVNPNFTSLDAVNLGFYGGEMKVVHDNARHVTCWVTLAGVPGGYSVSTFCLRDPAE